MQRVLLHSATALMLLAASTHLYAAKPGRLSISAYGGYTGRAEVAVAANPSKFFLFTGYRGGASVDFRLGKGRGKGLRHAVGLYGETSQLVNDFYEAASAGNSDGGETISTFGGGVQYSLALPLGRKNPLFLQFTAAGGVLSGAVTQTGKSTQDHTYGLGYVGRAGGGLGFRFRGKSLRRLVFFVRGDGEISALTSGAKADDPSKTVSDLKIQGFTVTGGMTLAL